MVKKMPLYVSFTPATYVLNWSTENYVFPYRLRQTQRLTNMHTKKHS